MVEAWSDDCMTNKKTWLISGVSYDVHTKFSGVCIFFVFFLFFFQRVFEIVCKNDTIIDLSARVGIFAEAAREDEGIVPIGAVVENDDASFGVEPLATFLWKNLLETPGIC